MLLFSQIEAGGEVDGMAERESITKVTLVGVDDYVAGWERIAAAIRGASEAKKEFDALSMKAPNSGKGV